MNDEENLQLKEIESVYKGNLQKAALNGMELGLISAQKIALQSLQEKVQQCKTSKDFKRTLLEHMKELETKIIGLEKMREGQEQNV